MSHSRYADDPGRVLRVALTANAISTAACGALFLAGAQALHGALGLTSPLPLGVVGVLFLVFAAEVWRARQEPLNPRRGLAICVLDVAYVVATVGFLLGWPRVLSPLGWWLTLGLAEVVTVFAIAEYVGLRRLSRTPAAA
jgi:hypothetical protein